MAGWDDNSPTLRENLERVLRSIRDEARRRDGLPSVEDARRWQRDTMAGLETPHPDYVGGFRGEGGALKHHGVRIGTARGVPPAKVAGQLLAFEQRLQRAVLELDRASAPGAELDADGLAATLERRLLHF